MDKETREVFTKMIHDILEEDSAKIQIENTKSVLLGALEKSTFNSERAQELFQMAIERSIMKKLGSTGASIILSIRNNGIIDEFAAHYSEAFIKWTGASDQRPARRGLLAKVLGK